MCVRPSTAFYGSFSLDMGRSPGFGPAAADLFALFRLGFPSAPCLWHLTSPATAARRTVLQKVRGCTHVVLPQLADTGFQVLFHSPPGVLFTFPSQYYALSVTKEYLALRGGPRSFPQGFSCPVVLWIPLCSLRLRLRGFHPLRPVFPVPFCCPCLHVCGPNPAVLKAPRFGLFPFRSPLLWESSFLSLPPAT